MSQAVSRKYLCLIIWFVVASNEAKHAFRQFEADGQHTLENKLMAEAGRPEQLGSQNGLNN